jgi:hypothetical protein
MKKELYTIVHTLYAFIAAMAVGMVMNVVLFFAASLLFAGANSDVWIRTYFGGGGTYFLAVTLLLACCCYPFTRKLNIVKRK